MRCANVCDVPVFEPYTTFSLCAGSAPGPGAEAGADCCGRGTSVDVGATAMGAVVRLRGIACT